MPASPDPSVPPMTHLEWLTARAALSDDAKTVALAVADGASLVKALVDGGCSADALRVLGFALPPRESVWWAWAAARYATQLKAELQAKPGVIDALNAVEQWVANPTDQLRRAAWAAGELAGADTPAGCAAAAAFFSTGSAAPADIPHVPPPPGLHNIMVGAAVMLSAVVEPQHFDAHAAAYIAQGVEVVNQVGGWDRSIDLSRQHFETLRTQHAQTAAPASAAKG